MSKHPITFLIALVLAALGSGCVGTGPNTQQGAVGGAALGALAGAIIGNNSGNRNAGQGALIGALAGAVVGGAIGNEADHERGTLYTSEAQATTTYYEARPPTPPYEPSEVMTGQPDPGAVWIAGYWVFTSERHYMWAPGRWEIPPPHHRAFVAAHWVRRGDGYVFVRGYWRS